MKRIAVFCVALLVAVAAQAGDGVIRKIGKPVRGKYIVKLYDHLTPSAVHAAAERVSRDHGVKLGYVWEAVVPSFAFEGPEAAALAIAHRPDVEWVEEEGTYTVSPYQSPAPWHLDRLDQVSLPLNNVFDWGCQSATTTVTYVVDTGIRATHHDFWYSATDTRSRVQTGANFVPDGFAANNPCPEQPNGTPCGSDPACYGGGHGTSVGSVIGGRTYGFVKDAPLVPVRTHNCGGIGYTTPIDQGLQWIYNDFPGRGVTGVVNISWGQRVAYIGAPQTTTEVWINRLVTERNLTVVVAADNNNEDARWWTPARLARGNGGLAITAGGSNTQDARWVCNPSNWFESTECTQNPGSNYGVAIDIFAPSQNVAAASMREERNGVCCYDSDTAERLAVRSGTSFAAPLVSGYAIRALSTGQRGDPWGVYDAIITNASAVMQNISDANSGFLFGSPNRLLYRAPGRCRP